MARVWTELDRKGNLTRVHRWSDTGVDRRSGTGRSKGVLVEWPRPSPDGTSWFERGSTVGMIRTFRLTMLAWNDKRADSFVCRLM